MTDQNRRSAGRAYEMLAEKFYRDQGYEILEKNWQAGHKEIDLIVRRENSIVFVEVKGSATPLHGHPAERVDSRKQQRLIDAARHYLISKAVTGYDLRFDVIAVVNGVVEQFPDAFGESIG